MGDGGHVSRMISFRARDGRGQGRAGRGAAEAPPLSTAMAWGEMVLLHSGSKKFTLGTVVTKYPTLPDQAAIGTPCSWLWRLGGTCS